VRLKPILILLVSVASFALAQETSFTDIQLPGADGVSTKGSLTFSDDSKSVLVRDAKGDLTTVRYDQIDRVSYASSKAHRVKQGAAVGAATLSPGAFLIVALTKSKSHWLYIDYHQQEDAKFLLLRLDKNSYEQVFEAVRTHTGKEVVMLGETTMKSSNDKKPPKTYP
jgi:hypothetical protein